MSLKHLILIPCAVYVALHVLTTVRGALFAPSRIGGSLGAFLRLVFATLAAAGLYAIW